METGLAAPITTPESVTADALALATWYAGNPAIRRIRGVEEAQRLRVIVALEPTHDGNDIYPSWLAHCHAWARDLQQLTGKAVQLELAGESPLDGIEFHADSTFVADVSWRDETD